MKIAKNITELIGNTPLVRLNRINNNTSSEIIAKLESFNPLSSIKDRIAKAMIMDAEEKGYLKEDSIIVEPTSGNTGIGLAYISAVKGYKLILTMPDTMTIERQALLAALGAEIVLTPGNQGMKGAIEKAIQITETQANAYMLQQFKNPANPEIHRQTTAQEIWEDTDGKIDIFIAGVGTGGTITGVGEILKSKNPDIKIIAVEPDNSPVLSGGQPAPHKIQGIGAGFIPEILNINVIDEIIKVSNEDAMKTTSELAKKEGLFVGISSGAAASAALKIANRVENHNKRIIVIFPDTGERYLSVSNLF